MENNRAKNKWVLRLFLERVQVELRPQQLFPSLAAGITTGVIAITVSTAFAALVFSGELSPYLPAGVGFMLFGTIVISGLVAVFSSFPAVVGGLQESAIAILSLSTLSILQNMPASATLEQKFYTVVAAIAFSSLITGAVFLFLGTFKLGDLIRYIPYPVVGGFLAGTGLLLVTGALGLLINQNVTIWELNRLFEPGLILHWLPGLIYAVFLVLLLRRYQHPFLMPVMLFGAAGVLYAGLWLGRISMGQAAAQGWLLGGAMNAAGGLWHPLSQAGLAQVHMPVLLDQMGNLFSLAAVSVITLLLNATGLELVSGQDLDLNRELKAAGIANLVAGLGGAMGGTHVISDSTLAYKMGARSKLVGLSLAGICAVVLFTGGAWLEFIPRLVLGGLLLYLGLEFLITWVVEAWFKLSLVDTLTVLIILLVINFAGMLQGLGLGLAIAVVSFVIKYSRMDVVKYVLTGSSFQSRVERPRFHQQLLREHGDRITILKLQGFLFFGTANKLLEHVRQYLSIPDQTLPDYMVLDFSQVSGLDASAVMCFKKMIQFAEARRVLLMFTHLQPHMERQLRIEALSEEHKHSWHIEADLYHGVEWCEEQIIRQAGGHDYLKPLQDLKKQIKEILPESGRFMSLMEFVLARNEQRLDDPATFSFWFTRLAKYLESREIQAGETLIHQGEQPKGLFFVESGLLAEQMEVDGESVRIRALGAGTLVGEVGYYLGRPAAATVIAVQHSIVYYLSARQLKQMETEDSEIAAGFHKFIAQALSEQLIYIKNALRQFMTQ